MIVWFLSFAAGLLAASVHYGRPAPAALLPVLLRLVAVTLVVAIALDAPAGSAFAPASKVALDVSESWVRATDSTAWKAALDSVRRIGGPLSYFGDSLRDASVPVTPSDHATRLRGVVDAASAAGAPVAVVTDGEVEEPELAATLPRGSRFIVLPKRERRDLAVTALDAPRALLSAWRPACGRPMRVLPALMSERFVRRSATRRSSCCTATPRSSARRARSLAERCCCLPLPLRTTANISPSRRLRRPSRQRSVDFPSTACRRCPWRSGFREASGKGSSPDEPAVPTTNGWPSSAGRRRAEWRCWACPVCGDGAFVAVRAPTRTPHCLGRSTIGLRRVERIAAPWCPMRRSRAPERLCDGIADRRLIPPRCSSWCNGVPLVATRFSCISTLVPSCPQSRRSRSEPMTPRALV